MIWIKCITYYNYYFRGSGLFIEIKLYIAYDFEGWNMSQNTELPPLYNIGKFLSRDSDTTVFVCGFA